jgi:tRNA-specific 2-thiouridylase
MVNKIAVLLSGGVDSSVTLYLAKEKYKNTRIEAVTLYLNKHNEEDIRRAKEVAKFFGVPHRILDLREEFQKRVIEYFINAYREGRTPNPCAVCNQEIKLGLATEILTKEGVDRILTGHYVRKVKYKGFPTLARAKDRNKDQTYFLALLKPEYLKYLEFPLEDFTKDEVKKIAKKIAIPTATRKESQDICFLERKKLKEFLTNYIEPKEGSFIYKKRIVGKHSGAWFYTVGQRRGLGLRLGKPVYVTKIDAKNNLVYVGDKEELKTYEVKLEKLNLFLPLGEIEKENMWGQVRYRTPAKEVEEVKEEHNKLILKFREPFEGVAKGQIGAIYLNNEILVGGGIIF